MPFRLSIRFVGLCHYVPLTEAEESNNLIGVYVALPLATAHDTMIEVAQNDGKFKRLAFIERGEIVLTLEPVEAAGSVIRFVEEIEIGQKSVYGAIPFQRIAPDLADTSTEFLTGKTEWPVLKGRMQLRTGTLQPYIAPKGKIGLWDIGSADSIYVGHGMEWTADVDLRDAVLRYDRFLGSPKEHSLAPKSGDGMVSVRISNECNPKSHGAQDVDFETHYKLVAQGKIRAWGTRPLPLPRLKDSLMAALEERRRVLDQRIVALREVEPKTLLERFRLAKEELLFRVANVTLGAGCNCLGATGLARALPK